MERLLGYSSDKPALVMGNAPSAFLLFLPLGFLVPKLASLLWMLSLLFCLLASVRMVWLMHGAPKNNLSIFGYSFAPALGCLAVGQVSLIVLLGLVLFLRFHRSSPYLAGAALWFCALKPQLFLPFGVVLIAWSIASRCHRLIAGAVSALAVSIAIAYIVDPMAWTQYGRMMSASRYDKLAIPCLSIILRRSISPNTMWLQYLPAILACIWAIFYFLRHRQNWDWLSHGSLLVLVSVLTAPYTWSIDQAILIPAVLHAVYLTRSRSLLALLALASAVIESAPIRGFALLHSPFYLWTAPAWLAWYLYATRSRSSKSANGLPLGVDVTADALHAPLSLDAVQGLETSEA
jgi:hypothetical protein